MQITQRVPNRMAMQNCNINLMSRYRAISASSQANTEYTVNNLQTTSSSIDNILNKN